MTGSPPTPPTDDRPGADRSAGGPLDDALMSQLREANPVPASAPVIASAEEANAVFERITSRAADFDPFADPAVASAETDGRARWALPRWPTLVAAAVAVMLLAGAVLVLAPINSEPALAVVQTAAEETAQARSGRIVTTFDLSGEGDQETGQVGGTITAAFNGDDFSVGLDIDPSTDVVPADEAARIGEVETRLIDGELFVTSDGQRWMSVDAPPFLTAALTDLTDLRTVLAEVQQLVEATEVGSTDIDGVPVTRYRSEVDLADESLAQSGWLPGMEAAQGSDVDIDAKGLVTIDLFVDDDGLMRRIQVSGAVEPADPTVDASATFAVTTDFVELGSDISIEPPDPELVEPMEFNFEEGGA